MLLSDRDIRSELQAGNLGDLDPDLIQPASVDLRLGGLFRIFDTRKQVVIDPPLGQLLTREVTKLAGEPFVLKPGEFALGTTAEKVVIPDYLAAKLEGTSSLGRLGLMVHSTAGWIDPGFHGQVTLELSNMNSLPIRLYPGMKVSQLCLFRLTSPAERPYGHPDLGSRYQGQSGPVPSRSSLNWA